MKKLLLIIALICLIPVSGWGASYYGCASGQALNSDALWCTADLVAGDDCTKDSGSFVAWATIAAEGASAVLYANGCTISLPDADITVGKISTKGDGAEGVGGGFTLATATSAGNTYTFDVEAGTTDCLTITGNGAGTPVNTIVGAVTGGQSANARGIYTGHTVGTIQITGNLTGSSGQNGAGIKMESSGKVTVTGDCIGGGGNFAVGCYVADGYFTLTGNSIGATSNVWACGYGIRVVDIAFGRVILIGNILDTTAGAGVSGTIQWNPSASGTNWNYHRIVVDANPTYAYLTVAPAASNVKLATNFGAVNGDAYDTGELASSSGGAWGF